MNEISPSLEVQNLWDFVLKGGWMMIPIGICSLVALTVIFERGVSLRRGNVIPADFLKGLKSLLKEKPGDKVSALGYCRKQENPIGRVLAAGIKKIDGDADAVRQHIDDAGQREALKLRKYLRVLSVVASVSPLLGLLGTIFGMIRAFQTVAVSGEALGKTEMLAGGIYEAMITTAAGLTVAIPALICYHWFSAKVDRHVMEIDLTTVEFIDEFVEPDLTLPDEAEESADHPSDEPAEELATV
jgi:biopolymer transport protein ExbB